MFFLFSPSWPGVLFQVQLVWIGSVSFYLLNFILIFGILLRTVRVAVVPVVADREHATFVSTNQQHGHQTE